MAEHLELARRRAGEAEMVSEMIALWCRAHHADREPEVGDGAVSVRVGSREVNLCPDCVELREYALARIKACPRMGEKTFCSVCPSPCYKPEMRDRIREVMRWSGPRMPRYRPLASLRHAFAMMRAKRDLKSETASK